MKRNKSTRREFLKKTSAIGLAGTLGPITVLNPGSVYGADKGKIRVGASLGLSGIFSGDGEEFRRGLIMATEEINAAGGIGGYELEPVVDDAQDTYVEQVKSSFERLLRQKQVDVVFAGFFIGTGVELDMVAEAGIPYVSQQAKLHISNLIEENRQKYRMIFQTCPDGTWYGLGFADFLKSVPGDWLQHGKTVAVIGGDNAYSGQIHPAMRPALKELGFSETHFEVVPYGVPDWTPTLTKLRSNPPSVIAMCTGIMGDDALFIKQFSDLPTQSLIYQVYTPSTPEYFDVLGDLANGVIWSSVIGVLPDSHGQSFRERYRQRWNGDEPSFAAAGPMYDQVHMWAKAAGSVADPKDSEAVSKALEILTYRGSAGPYRVQSKNLTVPSYPTQESDVSIGLPHAFYQISEQKHHCVWPDPYAERSVAKPSWMS